MSGVIGPVAILIFLFILGPIGLFVVGGIWSAVHGWSESEDADRRTVAEDQPA